MRERASNMIRLGRYILISAFLIQDVYSRWDIPENKGRVKRQDGDLCPENWLLENGYCYFISDHPVSYQNASDLCLDLGDGVTLVSIHDRVLSNVLADQIEVDSWIGLERVGQSSEYMWSDGTVYNYRHWDLGHPGIFDVNRCVQMSMEGGVWILESCDEPRGYVCHKPFDNNKCLSYPCQNGGRCVYDGDTYSCECGDMFTGNHCENGGEICPQDWQEFNGFCYYVGPETTYGKASGICQTFGPNVTLASIHDETLNKWLMANIPAPSFIGLYGHYNGDGLLFSWDDNSPTNFKNGYNFMADGHKCVYLRHTDGTWSGYPCHYSANFVCHMPLQNNKCVSYPCQNGGRCVYNDDKYTCDCGENFYGEHCQYAIWPPPGVDWTEFQGAYYHVYEATASFVYASQICKQIGGPNAELASILTKEEQLFTVQLSGGQSIWIGLFRLGPGEPFHWLDGSELTYSHWKQLQPDENQTDSHCVFMDTIPGFWNMGTCHRHFLFVCKLPNDQDGCISSPCLNGGRCIHGDGYHGCQCLQGYYGNNCQYREYLDDTISTPVYNSSSPLNEVREDQDVDIRNTDKVFIGVVIAVVVLVAIFVAVIVFGVRTTSRNLPQTNKPESDYACENPRPPARASTVQYDDVVHGNGQHTENINMEPKNEYLVLQSGVENSGAVYQDLRT